MALDVIRIVIRLWPLFGSIHNRNVGRACFRDQNGKQRRVTTKEIDRKKAKAAAEEYEKAVRIKRTLRQAQVALDRIHEENSGQKISRKSLSDFAKDWP
jgi:hypothetical protein